METKIKVGDRVRHVIGGPVMRVERIHRNTGHGDFAERVWFDRADNWQEKAFPVTDLERVPTEDEIETEILKRTKREPNGGWTFDVSDLTRNRQKMIEAHRRSETQMSMWHEAINQITPKTEPVPVNDEKGPP